MVYGGEFSQITLASGTEALLKLTDSKNFELANDVKLKRERPMYLLLI